MCHYTFDDEREKKWKEISNFRANWKSTSNWWFCLPISFRSFAISSKHFNFFGQNKNHEITRHTKKLCTQNHDGYAIGRLFVLVFYYNSIHSVSTLKRDRPPCICVVVEQPAEELEARFHRTHQLRISH